VKSDDPLLTVAQVATLKDPASARLGESLYTFMPRSVVGNLRDGVVMERERLRARAIPFFSLHNRHAILPFGMLQKSCLPMRLICALCSSLSVQYQELAIWHNLQL
jgi:hypothetical protein